MQEAAEARRKRIRKREAEPIRASSVDDYVHERLAGKMRRIPLRVSSCEGKEHAAGEQATEQAGSSSETVSAPDDGNAPFWGGRGGGSSSSSDGSRRVSSAVGAWGSRAANRQPIALGTSPSSPRGVSGELSLAACAAEEEAAAVEAHIRRLQRWKRRRAATGDSWLR